MRAKSKIPRPVRYLTSAARATARTHAEELIAQLYSQQEVQRRLVKRYRCTPNVAHDLYGEAMRELRAADDGDRENRLAKMLGQIGHLYRKAEKAGRLAVCRQLLTDVRRMQGIEGALKIDLPIGEGNPIESRTDDELEYFKLHAHWPEEAPRGVKPPVAGKPSSNPLDRLVH